MKIATITNIKQLCSVIIYLCLLAGCSNQASNPNAPAHHTADGFKNLYATHDKDIFDFAWMKLFQTEFPDNHALVNQLPVNTTELASINTPHPFQITWVGHSTVLIQVNGINILTDPIFSERASPVSFAGPKRFVAPAIDLTQLPKIDYVFISHNHYDHLDKTTAEYIGDQAVWLVPLKLKAWFTEQGITNVIELDWWQHFADAHISVTATPSQHWSTRSLTDKFETLWASWVIKVGEQNIWFGGDTGYNPHQFKEIGEKHGPFDLALIPIGSYAPRWFMQSMHVDPQAAVKIHQDIKSKFSVGIHWGTFELSAEPITEPPQKLQQALTAQQLPLESFVTLAIGETREIATDNEQISLQNTTNPP